MTNYYELERKYGTSGAERICTIAETFTNQVRIKMSTAIEWAVAQYEASQELPDRCFEHLTQGKG